MARPRARKRTRTRVVSPQSLLILHLDAEKLRADGLHLGQVAQFSALLASIGLGSTTVVRDARDKADLLRMLAGLATEKQAFDVIVVVAHSNSEGIRIASDLFVGWKQFAEFLKPLRPRRLLLAACRAGRWDAGDALFETNSLLRRIFACPVNASKDFASMMLFAVPYVVANRSPRDKHVLWTQFASVAFTGRQLREWRRTTDKANPDSAVFDRIADLADPIAKRVPGAMGTFLKTVLGRST